MTFDVNWIQSNESRKSHITNLTPSILELNLEFLRIAEYIIR